MKKYSLNTFSKGSKEWQHKKCCELLRSIYESKLAHDILECNELFSIYKSYLQIIGGEPILFDLEEISNRFHEHLSFTGRGLKEHNLLPNITQIDKATAEPYLPIDIYLDHIRSAHNVGSIIRTNEGLRIGSIWRSLQVPWIDQGAVLKTAMGCASYLELGLVCTDLSKLNRPLIGLETAPSAHNLNEFSFPHEFTLVLGNEEYGISQTLKNEIDIWVQIPMYGFKNSLNVANAFAITANIIASQHRSI